MLYCLNSREIDPCILSFTSAGLSLKQYNNLVVGVIETPEEKQQKTTINLSLWFLSHFLVLQSSKQKPRNHLVFQSYYDVLVIVIGPSGVQFRE